MKIKYTTRKTAFYPEGITLELVMQWLKELGYDGKIPAKSFCAHWIKGRNNYCLTNRDMSVSGGAEDGLIFKDIYTKQQFLDYEATNTNM